METSLSPPQRQQTARTLAVTTLRPFQKPQSQSSFPRCNGRSIPQRRSTVGPPAGYFSPSWAQTVFLTPSSLRLFLFVAFPPLHFYVYFQFFLSPFLFSPPSYPLFSFLLFHIGPFSTLPVLLRHFSSGPSSPRFATEILSISVLLIVSLFQSSDLLPQFSLSFSPPYYVPFVSQLCTW